MRDHDDSIVNVTLTNLGLHPVRYRRGWAVGSLTFYASHKPVTCCVTAIEWLPPGDGFQRLDELPNHRGRGNPSPPIVLEAPIPHHRPAAEDAGRQTTEVDVENIQTFADSRSGE